MDSLLNLGRNALYKKNEAILRPTDTNNELFYLVSGIVHSYSIKDSGNKNIHNIYGPGDIFPVTHIVNKQISNVYYEALEGCEIIRIEGEKVDSLIKSNIDACYALLARIAEQVAFYKALVDNLEYQYARERLAYRLLLLERKFGKEEGELKVIPRLSQDEIGNAINLSRESVSRELKRLERLGIIYCERGLIKIIDLIGLRKQVAAPDTVLLIDEF